MKKTFTLLALVAACVATESAFAAGTPSFGSVSVAYPEGTSHATLTVPMSATTAGVTYDATVRCTMGLAAGVYTVTQEVAHVHNGTNLLFLSAFAPAGGTTVYYELTVPGDASVTARTASYTVPSGRVPPNWWDAATGCPKSGGANIVHVRAGAYAGGWADGSDWMRAYPSLDGAPAAVTATRSEVWVAGVTTNAAQAVFAPTVPFVLRGGFAGCETNVTERLADAKSVVDGTNGVDLVAIATAQKVTVERLVFRHAAGRAMHLTGAGSFSLAYCDFLANGTARTAMNGRGVFLEGTETVKPAIDINNSTFAGNGPRLVSDEEFGDGGALCVLRGSAAVLSDVLFITNGVNAAATGGRHGRGSALYAGDTPVSAVRCVFRGNAGFCRDNSDTCSGGTVWLDGRCPDSAFTYCLFAGNHDRCADPSVSATHGGALVVNLSTAATKLTIDRSTFGYNFVEADRSPAGINVRRGKVTASNTIFADNILGALAHTTPCDAEVAGTASLTATYCLFTTATPASRYGITDTNCRYGSARFRSASPVSQLETAGGVRWFPVSAYASLVALDMRLRTSVDGYANADTSPAIDSANSALDYSDEPAPNGGRANMGYYGGTSSAARTPVTGTPTLDTTFGTEFNHDNYGVPTLAVTLGGSGNYIATISVVCKTGGVWNSKSKTLKNGITVGKMYGYGVHCGETVTLRPDPVFYVEDEDMVHFEITVTWNNGTTTKQTKLMCGGNTVEGVVFPPWYDAPGGGAGIIHVREGAPASGTGANWADACPNLASAILALSASRPEIWVCGTLDVSDMPVTFDKAFPVTVRGGFSGGETTAAARNPTNSPAVLDAANLRDVVAVVGAEPVVLENFVFRNGANHGLVKTSSGDLSLFGCAVIENARDKTGVDGRGLHVTGDGAATLVLSNVVVAANDMNGVGSSAGVARYSFGKGGGLYLENCQEAFLDECTFATNGVGFRAPGLGYGSSNCVGTAIYAKDTRVTMRRTWFVGNTGSVLDDNGGTVRLEGRCSGSVFSNCLWRSNFERIGQSGNPASAHGGGLVLALDAYTSTVGVDNCTFAFNCTDGATSPGGMNILKALVFVRNSLFYGNLTRYKNDPTGTEYGQDIRLWYGSKLSVCWSLFEAYSSSYQKPREEYVWADDFDDATYGIGMQYGDPLLVSTREDFQLCYGLQGDGYRALASGRLKELLSLSAHLRGGQGYHDEFTGALVTTYQKSTTQSNSPLLDKGEIGANYATECKPHGSRLNIGCYGNTPWSTMSSSGLYLRFR